MEITKLQIKMLSCCFLAGGLTLAGCSTDDSIDVGEVDTTIGVKLDKFSIPLGETEDITLGDVLDLKEDDCIRTNENGDYEFYKDGGEVTGAEPKVDPVKFANPKSETFALSFNPSALSSRPSAYGGFSCNGPSPHCAQFCKATPAVSADPNTCPNCDSP